MLYKLGPVTSALLSEDRSRNERRKFNRISAAETIHIQIMKKSNTEVKKLFLFSGRGEGKEGT